MQGLPEEIDFQKLARVWRKEWKCISAVIDGDDFGKVIQLSGDHRKLVAQFLIYEGIALQKEIKIHGF